MPHMPTLSEDQRQSTRRWLVLGTVALACSGILSIVLVLARAPMTSSIWPFFGQLFHRALVAHVDLSVLTWFLCLGLLLHRLPQRLPSNAWWPRWLYTASWLCMAAGTACLLISPFLPDGVALMNNYIPVLTNGVFFVGLGAISASIFLALLAPIWAPAVCSASSQSVIPEHRADASFSEAPLSSLLPGVLRFSIQGGSYILFIAFMAFFWSYHLLPPGLEPHTFYETLFWGGGHVLQFAYVQWMMIAWLILSRGLGLCWPARPCLLLLMVLGPIAVSTVPWAYIRYDILSAEHRQFFTWLMRWANGTAPAVLTLWIGAQALRHPVRTHQAHPPAAYALWTSLLLGILGGGMALLITGEDVTIPAHSHGSIGSVALALMGLGYYLLPEMHWRDVRQWRMARWQPLLYGGGQALHIIGLFWSGGYGVLRKTPGALEGTLSSARIAMGMMGLGGLLAIVGGILFVVVIWRASRMKTRA